MHYGFNYILYVMLCIIMVGAGATLQFRIFTINNFWSYALLFLLWGHVLIAQSFLLSVFISKRVTALIIGFFYVLGISLICDVLLEE